MQLGQSMSMRMDQRQILTPRMIQSMEILQMPLMALEERIDQELQSNPMLELKRAREDAPPAPEEPTVGPDNRVLEVDPNAADAAEFDRLEKLADYLINEEFSPASMPRRYAGEGERDGKLDALANTAGRAGSLQDHLLAQWRLADVDADLHAAGIRVIEHIEPDGYLRTPLEEIAAGSQFSVEQLEKALKEVQKLEPTGVGARSLEECLLLQLDAIEEDDELAEGHDFFLERALITRHLKDLEQNRYPKISRDTGREIDEIKDAVRRLARLNPAPGRAFGIDEAPPITPDAVVYYDEDLGRYEVRMTRTPGDDLVIRGKYRKMLAEKSVDKPTRDFLADKLRNAKWLIESIKQRGNTISRVIRIVVDQQQEFFEKGPEYLKPLPMIQVADMLGVHVATVSRAVSEKWIETPVGIFPLRRFFSMGTTSASGEEMSWDAVKEKVRKIIEEEDKRNPLSDDEIAAKAREQGIELARRTVAKYRKLLNIPTARQRRVF